MAQGSFPGGLKETQGAQAVESRWKREEVV